MGAPPVPSAPRDCLARVLWLSQLGRQRLQPDAQVTSCATPHRERREDSGKCWLRGWPRGAGRPPSPPPSPWLDKEPQMPATAGLMESCGRGSHGHSQGLLARHRPDPQTTGALVQCTQAVGTARVCTWWGGDPSVWGQSCPRLSLRSWKLMGQPRQWVTSHVDGPCPPGRFSLCPTQVLWLVDS